MDEYLRRSRAMLAAFVASVDRFDALRARLAANGRLAARASSDLDDTAARLRAAAGRLEHSLDHIEHTGLDIVDLQLRMEGEGASLAAALKALGEQADRAGAANWDHTLHDLDEAAERVAAAIFPSAIDGVREINRTLWEFRPIWNEYLRVLAAEVARPAARRRLTLTQVARVEETAIRVQSGFERVNALLNDLVMTAPASPEAARVLITEARVALRSAVHEARSKAADAYKPFHAVLGRAAKLARDVDELFSKLRVPVFPAEGGLDVLSGLIDAEFYRGLRGVERFALLNIAARLRSIPTGGAAGEHLLSPRFAIRIFDVFPDRIYLTADAAFIRSIERLVPPKVFEPAPASLHRFNDGSFKQRVARTGNLQVSFAAGSPEDASDATKVRVDADIDLYRSPVRHLFGEVLVNHLTGSKTDQFRVFDILAGHRVAPIGPFAVISV